MTQDFIHEFLGFHRIPSSCRVLMFSDDGDHFILFEDIDDGTSVTNASEQLATEIVEKFKLNPGDCRFFETYSQYHHDTVDEIEYTWNGNEAKHPRWKPAPKEIRELFNL